MDPTTHPRHECAHGPRPAAPISSIRHDVTCGGGDPPARIFEGHGTGYPTSFAVSRHAWRKDAGASTMMDSSPPREVTGSGVVVVAGGDSVECGAGLHAPQRTMTARHNRERTIHDGTPRPRTTPFMNARLGPRWLTGSARMPTSASTALGPGGLAELRRVVEDRESDYRTAVLRTLTARPAHADLATLIAMADTDEVVRLPRFRPRAS